MVSLTGLLVAAALAAVPPYGAARCSGSPWGWGPEAGAGQTADRYARALLAEAEAVVRVRAVAADSAPPAGTPPDTGVGTPLQFWRLLRLVTIRFERLEVLKRPAPTAAPLPDTLAVPGWADSADVFNVGAVPYTGASRERVSGCHATRFRLGGEYLLFLKWRGGRPPFPSHAPLWTPHWAIWAPTAEQLRGADDPWLRWVRAALAAEAPARRPE